MSLLTTARATEALNIYRIGINRGFGMTLKKSINRKEVLYKQIILDMIEWDDTNAYYTVQQRDILEAAVTTPTLDAL